MILHYLNHPGSAGSNAVGETMFRHFRDFPHPIDANVLPRAALSLKHLTCKGRNFSVSTMHPGNAAISFIDHEGFQAFGVIMAIWKITLTTDRDVRPFLEISPFQSLSERDRAHNPYLLWPGFQCTVVYSELSANHIVIEPGAIITHIAYYNRPPGTFGISKATTVVTESLSRNRT